MSFGGGGQTGGVVVGGPTPSAALLAGQYQASAAEAAAEAARRQTSDAINLIRSNYASAFSSLKPYTTEGIQALNELNQYMGLKPYDPGTAPTAPTKKTAADFLDQVTKSDIRNYVMQNTGVSNANNKYGQGFSHLSYYGAGSDDPTLMASIAPGWAGAPAGEQNPGGLTIAANLSQQSDPMMVFGRNPIIQNAVRQELAGDLARQANAGFDSQMEMYNQQKDVYDFAKQLQAEYAAQGPLTPEQVQAKLMAQPGVGFQYNQGLDAIQRAASAKGALGSGRLLQALSDYGQGVASQQYGETLSRLAGLAGMGQNAATNTASIFTNLGNNTGQLTANLGDTIANSFLAKGNAMAQSLLAANQQYKVIGQQDTGGGGMAGFGSLLGGLGSLIGGGAGGGSGLMGLFGGR
jgi:hypothetical protein